MNNKLEESKLKSRAPLFDVVKMVLMYLVVRGHLGPEGIVMTSPGGEYFARALEHSVKMPMFFMLAGYFSVLSFEKGSLSKNVAKVIC